MLDNNSIGNTLESANTVVDTSPASEGCTRDFDQCDQTEDACTILSCMSANTSALHALHALLSRACCVMSRIAHSKDTSGEDGEGEESVHDVFAPQRLLPVMHVLDVFTVVGLL